MMSFPAFKNFEEMEDCLSLDELTLMATTQREDKHNYYRFLAAMQGIDLDKDGSGGDETFEDIKHRAAMKVRAMKENKTEEQVEFEELGVAVITE